MNKISFNPFPEMETERLTLRRLTRDDVNEVYAIRSNLSVAEHLDRPLAQSIDDAYQFINRINEGINNNDLIYWVITQKDDTRFIGGISLWKIVHAEKKAEIGFELFPEHQGKGLMQEAVSRVIDYGLNVMGLNIIEAEVGIKNFSSIKLLQKNNFLLAENGNGKHSDEPHNPDTVTYKLTKVELF